MYYDLETDAYPVSESEIRAQFANASFPRPFVPPSRWIIPQRVDQPFFDAETQYVIEGVPVRVGEEVTQVWEIVGLTAEQLVEQAAELKSNLVRKIDSDADSIYTAALGNRATEYAQAEADATAYKVAAYSGQVPGYVQAWATATNKTAQWAADDILATAQGWRNAQAAIRLNRLTCKEAARGATTPSGVAIVEAQWAGFLSAIKTQLGIS